MYYIQKGYIHNGNTVVFKKADIKNSEDNEFNIVNIVLDVLELKQIINQLDKDVVFNE